MYGVSTGTFSFMQFILLIHILNSILQINLHTVVSNNVHTVRQRLEQSNRLAEDELACAQQVETLNAPEQANRSRLWPAYNGDQVAQELRAARRAGIARRTKKGK